MADQATAPEGTAKTVCARCDTYCTFRTVPAGWVCRRCTENRPEKVTTNG